MLTSSKLPPPLSYVVVIYSKVLDNEIDNFGSVIAHQENSFSNANVNDGRDPATAKRRGFLYHVLLEEM